MRTEVAKLVTFRLGDDLFAADIFAVERVLRFQQPTVVPEMPPWVEGVVEYQARVVPVINLRKRFELPDLPVRAETRILVLNAGGEWIGAIVDAVIEVSGVPQEQLSDPPALFRGLSAEFLKGIVRQGERLVIVLDIERLLATTARLVLERTESEAVARG